MRGYLFLASGHYLAAKNDFLKVLSRDSSDVFSNFYLAMVYNSEGQNQKAIYHVNKAKEAKEKLGYILNVNNDFSENLDINYYEINHFLGIILYETKRYEIAKRYLLFALRNDYYSGETFGYLAAIYFYENKKDSACYFQLKAKSAGVENVISTDLNCE